jgi:B12-binding domain/radical SAM domain protein
MAPVDLLLLHAPSVYDFRERAILYGPISDLIPSSPVFEMYPLGFLTLTNYLEAHGLEVRIVNLAQRMMNDPRFDVPAFLAGLAPRAVGIDLHWLPHAHGAIEVARIVKQVHPQVPVIFGGLSASYYHEELIRYPCVDHVLRGDSVESPLHELLMDLKEGRPPEQVPNLTWKRGGEVLSNPQTYVPSSLDDMDLNPARMIRMVLRYRDLQSVLPFNGWWRNPITAVFTVKGCVHQCVTCGSSSRACGHISKRHEPSFRSPSGLIKNIGDICAFSKGPIFLVGDLHQAGEEHARQVIELLKAEDFDNEIVFEFFGMPPAGFLRAIDESVRNWSIELSPESHDEALRGKQDASVGYSNAEMEAVVQEALGLRCHRIDVFFMIGLSGQTRESVMETIDYCEHLFENSDERLSCFISPLGPFLDPGSLGFEQPEEHGYTLFARTLEEHRQLLVKPSWQQILNYETRWMTREQLTTVTYDAGEALNRLKMTHKRISKARGEQVARDIVRARELKARLELVDEEGGDADVLRVLRGEIRDYSVSTVCDKRELFWKRHVNNFRWSGVARALFRKAGPGEVDPARG